MENTGWYQKIDKYLENVEDACNENDTNIISVVHDGNTTEIVFQFYSPAGRDFSFTVEVPNNLIGSFEEFRDRLYNCVKAYADNMDISYETYIWLDNFGHGRDDAPHDMRDLYNDTECCNHKISDLAEIINNLI